MTPGPVDGGVAEPRPQGALGAAPGKPLVWHLSLFAAALAIPALMLIILLFWRSAEAERARIDQEVRDVAKAVTVALDRDFVVKQSLLFALATAPSLHAQDYAAFHRQASALARNEAVDLVLRDLNGHTLADTRVPWGGRLPDITLDVDWQVIESRRAAVSNLFIDATSQQPSFAVVAPVVRDGEVSLLLSAVTPSERAVPILRDRLPADLWAASLSDRNGIIVARTRNHAAWVGTPITAQLRRAAVHASGTWDGPSHEGNPLRGGYARSPDSGWLAAVGVDRRRLMAPLHRMLWLTGTAAVGLAGLSALLAVIFGRRINRPILALADAAAALGRSGVVPRLHSGIAEVDGVSNALIDAAAELSERGRALRDSEQRLQIAVDAARLGTWDLDLASNTVVRSLRHDEMFGYSELQPEWALAIAERHILEEDRPLFRSEVARALDTGVLSFEVRVLWPDGSIHWIAPVGRTSYDPGGKPVRMAGVVADITERKEAEAALRESAELARARADEIQVIYDAVPIGIVLFDRDFRFLRINERLAAINGRSNADHVGRLIEEMLPAETAAALRKMQPRLLAGEEIGDVEISGPDRLTGKDGTFLVSYRPLRDPQGEVSRFLGTVLDITELKNAQEHQRLLLAELNHRVKNMLATVQAVADQTFQGEATADARQAFGARIVSLARTHDLLAQRSWQQAGLREVVLQALAPFAGPPGPRFDIAAANDVLLKPKAALALSMALHELATNAVKYGALSNGAGKVSVTWEVAAESGRRLRFSWRETGGPPVYKPSRRGFGTIMIERGLARELNAQVTLDYPREGLVFRVEMPLSANGAA